MERFDLAERIRSAVLRFKKDEDGCVTIELDDQLAVCVGWLGGYDEDDKLCIHSASAPSYCVNAGIKVYTSDDLLTDYEYINAPYYRSGDVWSTDVSILPDEDFLRLADYFLKEYEAMSMLNIDDDGEIIDIYSPDEYERYAEFIKSAKDDSEKLGLMKELIDELYTSYSDTAVYGEDDWEDYSVDDPDDFAQANLQEFADNLEDFYSMYGDEITDDDGNVVFSRDEFMEVAEKAFKELGYLK